MMRFYLRLTASKKLFFVTKKFGSFNGSTPHTTYYYYYYYYVTFSIRIPKFSRSGYHIKQ
ncbi:unnamed protein product, partial [Tenebrio molitor]